MVLGWGDELLDGMLWEEELQEIKHENSEISKYFIDYDKFSEQLY